MSVIAHFPIPYVAGYLALVLAGIFGALGVGTFLFGARRKVARGVVVGYEERRSHQTLYYPKVKFETVTGEKVVFTARFGSTGKPLPGRKVRVLYHPLTPAVDADISTLRDLWLLPFVLLDNGPEKSAPWFVRPEPLFDRRLG